MRPLVLAGILCIVVGLIAFAYQGLSHATHARVLDAGPLQVNVLKAHTFPLPPVVGVICLGVGLVLVIVGTRSPARPEL